eukprot:5219442-Pyramimonas_sp.AAC.1
MEKLIAANTEVPVSVQFNILKKKADVLWNKWVVDISNEEPLISYLQMFRPWDQQAPVFFWGGRALQISTCLSARSWGPAL